MTVLTVYTYGLRDLATKFFVAIIQVTPEYLVEFVFITRKMSQLNEGWIQNSEILQESAVTEITFGHKKVFLILSYHQTSDEFDLFLDRLQLTVDRIKSLKPHCMVITDDFSCGTK